MFMRLLFIIMMLANCVMTRAQNPTASAAVYRQGKDFMAKDNYPDAMASFFKAVALDKKNDSAWVQMGIINVKFQSFDTAIKFFNNALAINLNQVYALLNLASVYRNVKHDIDQALSFYQKALLIEPENKETWAYAAWCFNSKKLYDSAIVYCERALQLDNNYKTAYNEMGHSFHSSKQYQRGIDSFKKYAALSSSEMPVYYAGLCYIEINDKAGAMTMYDELTKRSPRVADVLKKKIDLMKTD